jgi:hypothetical protein
MRFEFSLKFLILKNFINFDIHKCHDVSTTSDQILKIFGSIDSSHYGASNHSIYMSFGLLDRKLLEFYCLEIFANNFLSINQNNMIILLLDTPGHDDSNKP